MPQNPNDLPPKKTKMLSIRLTEEQFACLDHLVARVKKETGTTVTRSSIVLKMLEYGLPNIESRFREPSSKGPRNFKNGA